MLSTLGIHELRGYARLMSAIGVQPELLEIIGMPGFVASEGRGLGFDGLEELAELGQRIRAGEESHAKVKLPRMYPKVWKALSRVANSERGYAEYAETLEQLERDQPVALRHAVGLQLAPRGPAASPPTGLEPRRRTQAAVRDQLDELRLAERDRLPRLRRGRRAARTCSRSTARAARSPT